MASELKHLGAANAETFQTEMQVAMSPELKAIEVDCADISFVDSHGLGALLLVQKTACNRHGDVPLRLLNPQPSVLQMLELTRMHRIFEIVNRHGDVGQAERPSISL